MQNDIIPNDFGDKRVAKDRTQDMKSTNTVNVHNVQVAIETTGKAGSLAIFRGETALQSIQLDGDSRAASSLAPALEQALAWCRQNEFQLGFVSVAEGPGSFTGLRIGVTTAKTLCYALQLPLVAVDSLAAVAANTFAERPNLDEVLVGLNAFRGQVFGAHFSRNQLLPSIDEGSGASPTNGSNPTTGATEVFSLESWLQRVEAFEMRSDGSAVVCGDEKVFRQSASTRLPDAFAERTAPDAVGVGLLGIRAAVAGEFREPLSLVPKYIKQSAAEEKIAGN